MKEFITGILLVFSSLSFSAFALEIKPLPDLLLASAISDNVVYDEDFDYSKLGRFTNLNLYPQGYRAKRNLVDHVVVYKQRHQMILMNKDKVVKNFWIALSNKPVGKKQYEGDKRTPEGTYILDYIKERSSFYRAFHISYPNKEDIANARRLGKRPGGMIMVHGQPPTGGEYQETVQRTDWTNGCIALLNPDIDIFMSLVDVGTPITIYP